MSSDVKKDGAGSRDLDKANLLGGVEREKKNLVNLAKVGKYLRTIGTLAFFIPFIALNVIAISRSMTGIINAAEQSTGEYGGEFDPSMGAEISSENGRALVVVHEGFGLDQSPWKWKDNVEYQEYLRKLQATKERYYNSGDIVVMVYDDKAWYDSDHDPKENTLYFVTLSNNGFAGSSVVSKGVTYSQTSQELFDQLKAVGVDSVEMAGEFRGLCVAQVADQFDDAGFKMGWCAECAFPALDQMNDPSAFPTLVPLP